MATEMKLGMKCIKYMLLTVNMMFILTATLIISVGTTIYAIYSDFHHFLDDSYLSPAILLVAIGVIMLAISVVGCWGAAKESTCMVNIFALLLSMVFILEIAATIAAFSLQGGLISLIDRKLHTAMEQYDKNKDLQDSMDFLQSRLGCCGINRPEDWSNYFNNTDLPDSCCAQSKSIHSESECETFFENGCMKRLTLLISQSAILLGTGAMTIAFIQFLGIIFAIMLGKTIRHAKSERERRRWEIREQIASAYTQMEPHKKTMIDDPAPVVYVPTFGNEKS